MRVEQIPEGCRIYKDELLVAVVTSRHHYRGEHSSHALTAAEVKAYAAGSVVWEPMDPSHVNIHFTSPAMKLDDVKAVLAALAAA